VDALIVLSRLVQFAAVSLLFGGSLFRLCIRPQSADQRYQWPSSVDIAAIAAALLSGLGWLIGVAVDVTGGWSDVVQPDLMAALLVDTRFGRLWIGRLALLAGIIALTLAWRRRTRTWEGAMLVLSGALTASLAGVGHGSVGDGMLGLIHIAADMIHLLCAATWLGGLACLALVLRRAVIGGDAESIDVVPTVLPRFSKIGYVAVAALLVTGCINTIVLVARPGALIETDYGRVLLVKISLVMTMIAIAGCNRFVFSPRVLAVEPPGRSCQTTIALYRSVAVEQVVGLLVLAAVALLGTLHPAPGR
jgi:putative copper resistance protein D